ncbi:M20 metallopeptidase family protein [Maridesulfovibrio bastinii]|uniref:M20 metallopeptidase family protein n=1 Tax=Maridesulfovibrio bastinii TaxID=47157 RepID=UPI000408E4B1|nr:amidohydrolase [Maridesulfovibrio bastinii]
MDLISKKTEAISNEIVNIRRDFHQHPELGLQEIRTGNIVEGYLKQCGLEVRRCHETGVIGILRGKKKGPALLMRADMDALPVSEETDLEYKSVNKGIMHACGHDAHTAILLGAAKLLSEMKNELCGTITFVFQPNEENVGALEMIEQGAMKEPEIDACMALHVWNQLPLGVIGISDGPTMAGMYHFELEIHGKGGHTANPHEAKDPVIAAAAVIQGVQSIQTREVNALSEPMVIMFGTVNAGTVSNVIPEKISLGGTLRYLSSGDDTGENSPRGRFERVVAGICAAHNVSYDLNFSIGHPTLVNDPSMAESVRELATEKLTTPLETRPMVTLAGEDFSEFACRAPSVFYFLGAGIPGRENYPHHHPCFEIDERVIPMGVEMHVRAALRFLNA